MVTSLFLSLHHRELQVGYKYPTRIKERFQKKKGPVPLLCTFPRIDVDLDESGLIYPMDFHQETCAPRVEKHNPPNQSSEAQGNSLKPVGVVSSSIVSKVVWWKF